MSYSSNETVQLITNEPSPIFPLILNKTNTIFVGPTMAGKTVFVRMLLNNIDQFFGGDNSNDTTGYQIPAIYVFTAPQSSQQWSERTLKINNTLLKIPSNINLIVETKLENIISELNSGNFERGSIVILDDIIAHLGNKLFVKALINHMAVNAHHRDLYNLVLVQEFFGKGKEMVEFRRQIHNYVLFKQNSRATKDVLSNITRETQLAEQVFSIATSQPQRPLCIMETRPDKEMLCYAGTEGLITLAVKEGTTIKLTPVHL